LRQKQLRGEPLTYEEQQLLKQLEKKFADEKQQELDLLERLRQKQLRGEPLTAEEQQLLKHLGSK